MTLVNLETGDFVGFDAGLGAEGITVTSQGDVWVMLFLNMDSETGRLHLPILFTRRQM